MPVALVLWFVLWLHDAVLDPPAGWGAPLREPLFGGAGSGDGGKSGGTSGGKSGVAVYGGNSGGGGVATSERITRSAPVPIDRSGSGGEQNASPIVSPSGSFVHVNTPGESHWLQETIFSPFAPRLAASPPAR